jgi:hypothetical protein
MQLSYRNTDSETVRYNIVDGLFEFKVLSQEIKFFWVMCCLWWVSCTGIITVIDCELFQNKSKLAPEAENLNVLMFI